MSLEAGPAQTVIFGGIEMPLPVLPTTVIGSYPQPGWLVNRSVLLGQNVPRIRHKEIWRPDEEVLEEAQDDATILAIRDMERAGIDIITDGEMRRESYSNRFGSALEGVDIDNPFELIRPTGLKALHPRVVGEIRRQRPIERDDALFLKAHTDRHTKITLPGPFTLAQQAHDEFYGDAEALTMAFAAVINEELKDLVEAGVDVVQLDEPWLRNNPEEAKKYAVKAINRAFEGITGVDKALHLCFGYAHLVGSNKPTGYSFLPELADTVADQISIEAAQPKLDLGVLKDLQPKTVILGVVDLNDGEAEPPETIAERLRRALDHLPAEKLIPAPDCGMKYLTRDLAFRKLKAMAEGAAIVRREIS
jgi:5-methyltetrahydropteroyltriglutamate--homocysteine methyltransferase